MNLCWGLFKWGLLVALIAIIAAVPYFYDRLDSEIRQRLLTMVSEQYDGLDISVRSAQFVENEGIEVRDLVIVEPDAPGPRAELLSLPKSSSTARVRSKRSFPVRSKSTKWRSGVQPCE